MVGPLALDACISQPVGKSTRPVVKDKQRVMPSTEPRSYCPINLSLEIFGDAWTLLVLRDMMFSGKRHFRELLQSDERISSNILADRLARLVEHGLLTKSDDPTHKQNAIDGEASQRGMLDYLDYSVDVDSGSLVAP